MAPWAPELSWLSSPKECSSNGAGLLQDPGYPSLALPPPLDPLQAQPSLPEDSLPPAVVRCASPQPSILPTISPRYRSSHFLCINPFHGSPALLQNKPNPDHKRPIDYLLPSLFSLHPSSTVSLLKHFCSDAPQGLCMCRSLCQETTRLPKVAHRFLSFFHFCFLGEATLG